MIVGVNEVVSSLVESGELKSEIGDYLVGIHVGGCSSSALEYVNGELVHTAAFVKDCITGTHNRVRDIVLKHAYLFIGQRGGLFHHDHSAHELRYVGYLGA